MYSDGNYLLYTKKMIYHNSVLFVFIQAILKNYDPFFLGTWVNYF